MYFIEYANKDSSIYELTPSKNTGGDEILEIGKISEGSLDDEGVNWLGSFLTRSLIAFNLDSIQTHISSSYIGNTPTYHLQLFSATTELPHDATISVHPLSESFDEGVGTVGSEPIISTSSTWSNRADGIPWSSGSNSFNLTNAGGAIWSSESSSVVVDKNKSDLMLDVTDMVNSWLSGALVNNGFVIKLGADDENKDSNYRVSYFGRDTHTIFMPRLVVRWDSSDRSGVSSVETIDVTKEYSVYSTNCRPNYMVGEIANIRFVSRERYQAKAYSTIYTRSVKVLPETTYYQIRDLVTGTTFIPFDNSTKLSADDDGNFFAFDVSGLMPYRVYVIDLKVVSSDTDIRILQNVCTFKVRR
jgi:hypothetical protein